MLAPRPGETLLDIGCGTGYFTRRFARETGVRATGLDPNEEWLAYAIEHSAADESYLAGRAESLPFLDRRFDCTLSVTALCFVDGHRQAISELLRVTGRRFAIGLLNRNSALYSQKAGIGAYRGARWQTPEEIRALFGGLPVRGLELRSAVFLPNAGAFARFLEPLIPSGSLRGALLAVAGNVVS